ncbi:hypothetical protein B7494_g1889 [Chlorociboria aeruginascens]|nr:hypothetical protein B7494_g1889 [Chlorociboria aeruginascens]
MDDSQSSRAASAYTARLDLIVQELQERVKELEATLHKLHLSTATVEPQPASDRKVQFQQMRALKIAYEILTPNEPYLPSPHSPLPGLLALQATDKCIKDTEECIIHTNADLKNIQQRLEKEQADLKDANFIHTGLVTRINSLNVEIEKRTKKSPGQAAKDMIRGVREKKARYDVETGRLVKAFNRFIDDHLALMLAAEELGGPIVGERLDIDEEMLQVGFGTRGKTRKTKIHPTEDKRQRRIDEIWGPRPTGHVETKEPWNEQLAAATEMRELTEQLLNSLVETDGGGSGTFVVLPRESAAARFLVRSKVAQFHPKDASKLRLVDFGSELDD